MGYHTENQLKSDGYIYSVNQTFSAPGDVLKTKFNFAGGKGMTPPQWLQRSLAVASGLGIFDTPVTQEREDGKIEYSFHFKDELDKWKFHVAIFGLDVAKDKYFLRHRLCNEVPDDVVDSYVSAVLDFCEYHNLACSFSQEKDALKLTFDSNADFSAYLHAANRDKTISSMRNNLLKWANANAPLRLTYSAK